MRIPAAYRSRIVDNDTRASLARSGLASFPTWLEDLTGLRQLDLSGNQLSVLPETLGNLTSLTTLNLSGNLLFDIPESMGNLRSLTTLNLRNNALQVVPESLGNLYALTSLDLSGNQLSMLPETLGNLTSLTTLNLSGNLLFDIPESLCDLTDLAILDLNYNQLTRLPRNLADRLINGLKLDVKENPLNDPLPKLVARGAEALAVYLGSLEDATPQYDAKLLLVGEGSAGKTSLVAALRGAPFIEGRPTTHGIEIWSLTVPHPSLSSDITLRAWDFGGQELYRVTHQFFFTQRAIYLVVWSARRGQEQDEVEGWLHRIKMRVGRDARTMVIATHCADRLTEMDYPRLEDTFPEMLVGNFEVDSRTGTGLSDLREAIGQQAALLPQMGQSISHRWVSAREEILACAEMETQIKYEQFAEICERHKVTGPEIFTLAQLMNDSGQIIYYSEDEGLRDIVVLNPEWLTKAISYVLEDQATKDAGGVLDHAHLREIWLNRIDGPSYPIHYHPYFLRLMEKFDVSYRLEGDDLHSLVAQLVPNERPRLPWQQKTLVPAGIRSLAIVCRLSEPAPGLIPWLTVRHHRASTGLHWRRGAFLRHPISAYASEALLELSYSGDLILEVRAPSPDLYFNVLRESIEDLIMRRWPGLSYQLLIPCPGDGSGASGCPGLFPLNGLLKLRERGHSVYPCIECTQVHEISVLLTGFTAPTEPLPYNMKQMHEQLARVEKGMIRLEGRAAETAEYVRRVLRVVSAEVTDCPSLITLVRIRPTKDRRLRFCQHHYRLTLWCEHPGYWHPWSPASYELDPPKEWFSKVSPYLTLIFRTLQLIVPLAGSIAVASLPTEQIESAEAHLEMMKVLVDDLPNMTDQDLDTLDPGEVTGQGVLAEGAALRAIRAIIFQHDQLRTFGGLRRVQAPSGDFLWICKDHYGEYDPGLPMIPYSVGSTPSFESEK